MAEAISKKFNLPKTTTYIIMPLDFTGKDKRFNDLTNAYRFLLAEIYTANRAVKGYAKLTYEHFVQKFGMSKETVSDGLRKLEALCIIERLGNSRYKIIVKFNKNDYIIIDDYLHKQLWDVAGVQKRLARSRIITLEFLNRECSNPKTFGLFISSQARMGVAINMPRTTAGDCIRELASIGVITLHRDKNDPLTKDAYKLGLTRYLIHPELKAIKRRKPEPPKDEGADVKSKQPGKEARARNEWRADVPEPLDQTAQAVEYLKQRLMRDDAYKRLRERLQASLSAYITAVARCASKDVRERAEGELDAVELELKAYLKAHGVPPDMIEAVM